MKVFFYYKIHLIFYLDEHLMLKYKIVPVKELKELKLCFPLPSLQYFFLL